MLDTKKIGAGEEQHEVFFTGIGRRQKKMVQYDYRARDGELFSCVRHTLENCRRARDEWLIASGRA